MTTQIREDLFCIELPLPNSPLKSINCYLIKGKPRSLIIDTGMNRVECRDVLFPSLSELGVDLGKTDVFITHLHADHSGLIGDLQTDGSKCYFGRTEASVAGAGWESYLKFLPLNGFPEELLKESLSRHPGVLYGPSRKPVITPVDDGQVLKVGDFELTCVETPGHSPGHMCLYEAGKKILFSGDHILFDITPNITWWADLKDSLRQYLESLDRVAKLEVSDVFPGHRSSMHGHLARIDELKKHHRARLDEALKALREKDMTAYEVAPYITWKIAFRKWADFPIAQKFFAVGETLAHLHYLETDGTIRSYRKDGKIYYTLARDNGISGIVNGSGNKEDLAH